MNNTVIARLVTTSLAIFWDAVTPVPAFAGMSTSRTDGQSSSSTFRQAQCIASLRTPRDYRIHPSPRSPRLRVSQSPYPIFITISPVLTLFKCPIGDSKGFFNP